MNELAVGYNCKMTGAIRCKNNPTGSGHPVGPSGSVFSVIQ